MQCRLREDLLVEVRKLAEQGEFDYLLIEGTGIAEPMPIAETFTFELEQEDDSQVARYAQTRIHDQYCLAMCP